MFRRDKISSELTETQKISMLFYASVGLIAIFLLIEFGIIFKFSRSQDPVAGIVIMPMAELNGKTFVPPIIQKKRREDAKKKQF